MKQEEMRMLTPDEIDALTEQAAKTTQTLNQAIIRKIIERLVARLERGEDIYFTRTDYLQAQVLEDSGALYDEIIHEVAKYKIAELNEIHRAFQTGFVQSWNHDSDIYRKGGMRISRPSERYLEILQRNYEKTAGEFLNMTGTIAQDSTKLFRQTMSDAYMQTMTGAVSNTEAMKDAVNKLAGSNIKCVHYDSGRVDTIETASLRAIRTGVAQTAGDISIKRMEEMGWDIVLVSAHFGARPDHMKWQGKFYSLHGKTPNLPDFVTSTDYGTVTGLCGANCRHHFGPGTLDFNPYENMNVNSEESKKRYELSQKQRAMERDIRRSKTKCLDLQAGMGAAETEQAKAALQTSYRAEAKRLTEKNAKYNAFCKDNNLKPYPERCYVAGWDRSQAAKASAAARK